MPRYLLPIFLAALVLSAVEAPAAGADSSGNVNLLFGSKTVNKDDWGEFRRQGEFGILTDFKKADWPVSIAIDLLASGAEKTGVDPSFGAIKGEAGTSELDFGVRKIWEKGRTFRPLIGGGLGLIGASLKLTQVSTGSAFEDSDSALGVWFCGGVYWTLGKAFNIGLQARYSAARAELFGTKVASGGAHFGTMIGWHWGGRENERTGGGSHTELEERRLKLEEDRLQLERERLEFEKQKQAPK